MNPRIAITGAGAVHPLGHDLAAIAAQLGRTHSETGPLWPISGVDDSPVLSGRLKRKLDMFSVWGMVAADMALKSSRLEHDGVEAEAVGIYVGNCLGGWGYTQPELEALHTRGVTGMGPYVATAWFPAALQGQLSLAHGFKGHSKTFSARDVAGLQAIVHAAGAIRAGRAEVVLCGASEDVSSPYMQAVLRRYEHANALSTTTFGALAPSAFCGGSAFVVLEDYERALRRGAPVMAEITGFADCFCSQPQAATRVMAGALQAAEGRRQGERLLVLDGLQGDEAALATAAAREAHIDAVPVNPRAALPNQFAVSGVTELALLAHALSQGSLRTQSLGAHGAGGRFMGALIQRLSPQGNVVAVGLTAA